MPLVWAPTALIRRSAEAVSIQRRGSRSAAVRPSAARRPRGAFPGCGVSTVRGCRNRPTFDGFHAQGRECFEQDGLKASVKVRPGRARTVGRAGEVRGDRSRDAA